MNGTHQGDAGDLRRRADEKVRAAAGPQAKEPTDPTELQRLVHELQVHQIELEMQNEELRRAHVELDAARERYFDLYDLAPVGYLTVDEAGLILEANLTAASLLDVARDALARQPFSRFIPKEVQDIYYLHRKQLFETAAPQVCELWMLKNDGTQFWARLEAAVARDHSTSPGQGAAGVFVSRVVLSDITARKMAEDALLKALHEIRTLRGIVPICAYCKKIRDDQGSWKQMEVYVRDHTEAEFSHGICPECVKKISVECTQFKETDARSQAPAESRYGTGEEPRDG
jgi:PAS domain S-box-containing protein